MTVPKMSATTTTNVTAILRYNARGGAGGRAGFTDFFENRLGEEGISRPLYRRTYVLGTEHRAQLRKQWRAGIHAIIRVDHPLAKTRRHNQTHGHNPGILPKQLA